jgi:hypothetical protein
MVERPVQVDRRLLVHGDQVRARVREASQRSGFSIMRWQSSGSAVVLRIDSTIGGPSVMFGTVAVHHVHVDETRPALLDRANLLAETREIRGRSKGDEPSGSGTESSSRDHQHHALALPHGRSLHRLLLEDGPGRFRGARGVVRRGSPRPAASPRPLRPEPQGIT